jgi:DNA-directed RNA polymerase subunit RPC12/RpoP
MVKCPTCKKEVAKPEKIWKYGRFLVDAYSCSKCGTHFREYTINGKHSFMLIAHGRVRRKTGEEKLRARVRARL